MTIEAELTAELEDAMRGGDAPRRDVIRQIRTEVAVARTAPGFTGEVDDALYRTVIASYVKKMRKAVVEYERAGERGAQLADKLRYEIDYLSRWLPRTLGEEETRALVRSAVDELGVAGDPKATGKVVGHVMRERGDELDGALVSRLARQELGG